METDKAVARNLIMTRARQMRATAARADRYEYMRRETDAANAWEAAELAKLDD